MPSTTRTHILAAALPVAALGWLAGCGEVKNFADAQQAPDAERASFDAATFDAPPGQGFDAALPDAAPPDGSILTACQRAIPNNYRSVEEQACGRGFRCHFPLDLGTGEDPDGFTWMQGDIFYSGTFLCDDGELTGITNATTFTGTINPDNLHIIWDGLEYEIAPPGEL